MKDRRVGERRTIRIGEKSSRTSITRTGVLFNNDLLYGNSNARIDNSNGREGDSNNRSRGLTLAALDSAALVRPIEETFQLVAVFPAQFEELGGGHVGGFGTEKSFKAPAKIGAVPGIEAIVLGRQPVVAEELPHSICGSRIMSWSGLGAGVF